MGILTGLTVTSYYGDFNITSPYWAMLEFTYNIVRPYCRLPWPLSENATANRSLESRKPQVPT